MSEIRHQWNGTVLTVISDSGASSMDLAGPKGDTGCRGPQGPAGVIYGEDGEIVTNLSNYYTKEEIDSIIYGVGGDTDFSVYATKDYVLTEIEKAQLDDIEIDLSSYATKSYVNSAVGTINLSSYATKSYVDQAIAASGGGSGGSISHSWNGSILSVTSASGTSSADLRGPAGKDGDDYVLTSADKAQIVTTVKNALFTFDAATGRLDITV